MRDVRSSSKISYKSRKKSHNRTKSHFVYSEEKGRMHSIWVYKYSTHPAAERIQCSFSLREFRQRMGLFQLSATCRKSKARHLRVYQFEQNMREKEDMMIEKLFVGKMAYSIGKKMVENAFFKHFKLNVDANEGRTEKGILR